MEEEHDKRIRLTRAKAEFCEWMCTWSKKHFLTDKELLSLLLQYLESYVRLTEELK